MRSEKRGAQGVDATAPHDCNSLNEQRLTNLVFFREQINYCRILARPMINQIATKPSVLTARQKLIVSLRMLQESPIQIIAEAATADAHPGGPSAGGKGEIFPARGRPLRNRPRAGSAPPRLPQTQLDLPTNSRRRAQRRLWDT